MLGPFRIFPIALNPENIYILEDTFSKIWNDEAVVSDVEVLYFDFSKIVNGYNNDKIFRPIVQSLEGT